MWIVAGPFLPAADWHALEAAAWVLPGLRVDRSVPNLGDHLRLVAVSVSQCGYNTALDVVASGVRALVVPFSEGREDEQSKRAQALAKLGAVRVLAPQLLDGATLAEEIRRTLAFAPSTVRLNLDGARTSARIIARLARARGEPAVPLWRTA